MSVILRSRNLTKRFPGVIANEDVNFDLESGEVHCLFGENGAGKSTLSACLFGYYRPEGGSIEFEGKEVRFKSPRHAIDIGIGMVHQHFVLVADFTVIENIIVGTHSGGWRLNKAAARKKILNICQEYDISLDLDARVGDLAVGQQQWVEILKALYLGAKILILDEPSAVLTPEESKRLFRIINHMCEQGLSVILISHKMAEVMQADRVTVLRKGKVVDTVRPTDVTPKELTRMMVGRDIELRVVRDRSQDAQSDQRQAVLVVENLQYRNPVDGKGLKDVSFTINRGEIVGLAGVSGNGQKELFELVAGVLTPTAGSIKLDNESVGGKPARYYMDRGVGSVPDDRFREGLIPSFGVGENVILGWQRSEDYCRGIFLDHKQISVTAQQLIDDFQISTPSVNTHVSHLSGGNAQKVILAREFVHSSNLLLANQPTRGLDLGVIEYVYNQLVTKRDEGYAILLASEELEDLLNLSDRILVIHEGRITGVVDPNSTTIEEIGFLMAGGHGSQNHD